MFVTEAQTDCVQLTAHDWVPSSARKDKDADIHAYLLAWKANQTQGLRGALKQEDGWFNPACFIHTEFTDAKPIIGGVSYIGALTQWLGGLGAVGDAAAPVRLMDDCGDDVFCGKCSINFYC